MRCAMCPLDSAGVSTKVTIRVHEPQAQKCRCRGSSRDHGTRKTRSSASCAWISAVSCMRACAYRHHGKRVRVLACLHVSACAHACARALACVNGALECASSSARASTRTYKTCV
eukprot:6184222-Pleurochrysis_carterae.AAC.3